MNLVHTGETTDTPESKSFLLLFYKKEVLAFPDSACFPFPLNIKHNFDSFLELCWTLATDTTVTRMPSFCGCAPASATARTAPDRCSPAAHAPLSLL
jgi:hypothetical protein